MVSTRSGNTNTTGILPTTQTNRRGNGRGRSQNGGRTVSGLGAQQPGPYAPVSGRGRGRGRGRGTARASSWTGVDISPSINSDQVDFGSVQDEDVGTNVARTEDNEEPEFDDPLVRQFLDRADDHDHPPPPIRPASQERIPISSNISRRRRPAIIPNHEATGISLSIPLAAYNRMKDGWSQHLPLTLLTDAYCERAEKHRQATTPLVSITDSGSVILANSVPSNTPENLEEAEYKITFPEWTQAYPRLLALAAIFFPDDVAKWEAHYAYIANLEGLAAKWDIYRRYDIAIRRISCKVGIDPSIEHPRILADAREESHRIEIENLVALRVAEEMRKIQQGPMDPSGRLGPSRKRRAEDYPSSPPPRNRSFRPWGDSFRDQPPSHQKPFFPSLHRLWLRRPKPR